MWWNLLSLYFFFPAFICLYQSLAAAFLVFGTIESATMEVVFHDASLTFIKAKLGRYD